MLAFHQFMWTVESELPNRYEFAIEGDLDPLSVWCDQPDMQGWLGEAWTARRTDDWSFFESKVARATVERGDVQMDSTTLLLMHSLNHLLMYSGPGWHPLLSLDQLVDEYPLLGGFTSNFKRAWAPLFPALQTYWRHSRFAPHAYTGTDFEKVLDFREKGFWVGGGDEASEYVENWIHGDSFHLSTHCGAPSGFKHFDVQADERRFEVFFNQENIVTMTGTDYTGWMAFLRKNDFEQPQILVKYNISSPVNGVELTLGHFLVTREPDSTRLTPNRVCFLTDNEVPLIMNQLVGFVVSDDLR